MEVWNARANKGLESQSSNHALRVMAEGKWKTYIESAKNYRRKCQNVHGAMETESLIIWWQPSVLQYQKDNAVYLKTSFQYWVLSRTSKCAQFKCTALLMVPVIIHTFTFGLLPPPLVRQLLLTCPVRKEERGRLTIKHTCIISNRSLQLHR